MKLIQTLDVIWCMFLEFLKFHKLDFGKRKEHDRDWKPMLMVNIGIVSLVVYINLGKIVSVQDYC